jgi:hypothetical protein
MPRFARLKHPFWLLKKNDQGDHYLACTTRMFEIKQAPRLLEIPFGSYPSHFDFSKPLDSHPRGCPTIHLSKSKLSSVVNNLSSFASCERNLNLDSAAVNRWRKDFFAEVKTSWSTRNCRGLNRLATGEPLGVTVISLPQSSWQINEHSQETSKSFQLTDGYQPFAPQCSPLRPAVYRRQVHH